MASPTLSPKWADGGGKSRPTRIHLIAYLRGIGFHIGILLATCGDDFVLGTDVSASLLASLCLWC